MVTTVGIFLSLINVRKWVKIWIVKQIGFETWWMRSRDKLSDGYSWREEISPSINTDPAGMTELWSFLSNYDFHG